MIGYDTHGAQYPPEWDEPENHNESPEFRIAEEYLFTYFLGASILTGSVWTKSATKSGKSLLCVIKIGDGRQYNRTIKVRHDDEGEFIMIPEDILRDVNVRA